MATPFDQAQYATLEIHYRFDPQRWSLPSEDFSLSPRKLSMLGRQEFAPNTSHKLLNGGVQFDLSTLDPLIAIGKISRIHACIGYDPRQGWTLINGGPVSPKKEKRAQSPRHIIMQPWQGELIYWCRAISPPMVHNEAVTEQCVLHDGDSIVFADLPDFGIAAVLRVGTAGGKAVISHPTYDGLGEEVSVASTEPLDYRTGQPLRRNAPATYIQSAPYIQPLEQQSLTKSPNKIASWIGWANNAADDTANSWGSWVRVIFLFLLVLVVLWAATHINWGQLQDAKDLLIDG